MQDLWRCRRLTALCVGLESFADHLVLSPITPGSLPALCKLSFKLYGPKPDAEALTSLCLLTTVTSLEFESEVERRVSSTIVLPTVLSSIAAETHGADEN